MSSKSKFGLLMCAAPLLSLVKWENIDPYGVPLNVCYKSMPLSVALSNHLSELSAGAVGAHHLADGDEECPEEHSQEFESRRNSSTSMT